MFCALGLPLQPPYTPDTISSGKFLFFTRLIFLWPNFMSLILNILSWLKSIFFSLSVYHSWIINDMKPKLYGQTKPDNMQQEVVFPIFSLSICSIFIFQIIWIKLNFLNDLKENVLQNISRINKNRSQIWWGLHNFNKMMICTSIEEMVCLISIRFSQTSQVISFYDPMGRFPVLAEQFYHQVASSILSQCVLFNQVVGPVSWLFRPLGPFLIDLAAFPWAFWHGVSIPLTSTFFLLIDPIFNIFSVQRIADLFLFLLWKITVSANNQSKSTNHLFTLNKSHSTPLLPCANWFFSLSWQWIHLWSRLHLK